MLVSRFLPGNDSSEKNFFFLLLLHLFIGIFVFYFRFFSVAYGLFILLAGLIYVFRTKDKNLQILQVVAYFSGAEVFLRMTHGNLLYEYGRYGALVFFLIGLLYSGFCKKTKWLWLSLLLLLPGVFVSVYSEQIIKKSYYVYVFIGPLVTIIGAVYSYSKQVTFKQLQELLLLFVLPIVPCLSFLILDYPQASKVFYNMESNPIFTGDFGPNQVATVFGLCVFIILGHILIQKMHLFFNVVYFLLMTFIFYRCLLTFSRGGMITSIIICAVLLYQVISSYERISDEVFKKIKISIGLVILATTILVFQSDGFIIKRYAVLVGLTDKNDESKIDRGHLMSYELKLFSKKPVFGNGVGIGVQKSLNYLGTTVSSHNEITRLMAEHGILGLFSFLILLIFPVVFYKQNQPHIYFWGLYLFWLITIFHSGLRLAAPSFIYALTLLKVNTNNNHSS